MEKTAGVICNKCGRSLPVNNDIIMADFIEINKKWGYFSGKDGKSYRFILCEECSDKLMKEFVVPVQIEDTRELL